MLVDFGVYGSDKPGSFDLVDLRLLNSERWVNKLERAFARTPFEFNIYAYNTADGKCFGADPSGGHNAEQWAGLYDERMLYQAMNALPERWKYGINYLLVENEGDDRLPLTPWIVAHRFSHAMGYQQFYVDGPIKECGQRIDTLYFHFKEKLKLAGETDVDYVHRLGTHRASRNRCYMREGEFLHDVFAQHLIGGGIRFSCESETARKFEEGLTNVYNDLLAECVGKVVVI